LLLLCHTQEAGIRRIRIWSQSGQIVQDTLSQKYPTQTRGSRMAQVAERLHRKCEALRSNLSTAKKKKERESKRRNLQQKEPTFGVFLSRSQVHISTRSVCTVVFVVALR
jgi:hypothetical protein